jgi:hypothetical protein
MTKANDFDIMNLLLNDELKAYADHAKEVIERPLDKSMIKERDAGFGRKLSYISGSTVINILNEAFGYWGWNFEVVEEKIVQSVPKFNKKTNSYDDQPPYIQILGRLTVPLLGIVKEQYGTKTLIGGASEQEGAAKSAGTDALKKCATLLGVGNELYEDAAPEPPKNNNYNNYQKNNYQKKSDPPKKDTTPPAATKDEWDEGSVKRLGEFKVLLGITENSMLDPFVKEFTSKKDATYLDVTPDNIKDFNEFLITKVPGM